MNQDSSNYPQDRSEDEQLIYETIATSLERIILMSNNRAFREKCLRLLLVNGGTVVDLKSAILLRLYQQASNRKRKR